MWEHDFRDYKRFALSASDSGRGILVAATASPGTTIHTALASQSTSEYDQVWLRVTNTSASPVLLTILWGGTSSPGDVIQMTIPAQSGFTEVVAGHPLQNAKVIAAYAATANVLVVHGYVNRYQNTQQIY